MGAGRLGRCCWCGLTLLVEHYQKELENIQSFAVGEFDVVDNTVVGSPEIDCMSHLVSIKFSTSQPFNGHVFVAGHFAEEDCHKDYVLNQGNSGFMDVKFEKCGMRRQRTTNPKGMTMSAKVVVSFHRTFITHKDKAYHIECFYLEDERIVTQNLHVSMLPTTQLEVSPPMPSCKYQVLDGGPEGQPISYARIGDTVYHQWHCDYPMPDMYCMVIHSCSVDDGEQATYDVVDDKGCSTDPVILDQVGYSKDLKAGTVSQVFKFADKPHVYFSCQVRLSLKTEHHNDVCPLPSCGGRTNVSNSSTRRLRYRTKRQTKDMRIGEDFDVVAKPVMVLDLDDPDVPTGANRRFPTYLDHSTLSQNEYLQKKGHPICLSTSSFAVLVAAAILSCLMAILFSGVFWHRWRTAFSYEK